MLLQNHAAIQIQNTEQLQNTIEQLINNQTEREKIKQNAQNIIRKNKGVLDQYITTFYNIYEKQNEIYTNTIRPNHPTLIFRLLWTSSMGRKTRWRGKQNKLDSCLPQLQLLLITTDYSATIPNVIHF